MIISAIPVTLVEVLWPQIEPHFISPCRMSNNETTPDSIKQKALAGDLLILTMSKGEKIVAALTLEVMTFDTGKKSMFIGSVGGKYLNEWMDRALSIIKAIAKDFGCTEIRGGSARKGWMKKLKDTGFKETYTTLCCEV